MKILKNISIAEALTILERPEISTEALNQSVQLIINDVRLNGDAALKTYSLKYDNIVPESFNVSNKEIEAAIKIIPQDLKSAIDLARSNITKFHKTQINKEQPVETADGVVCWRKSIAIENVGLYVPGGSAPLFSTVLMLGIPAKLAGCKNIVLCTPVSQNGSINPVILYTANLLGITQIYKVGGPMAIAAMTYGTESIPMVYKIFGPGNQYVTKAKSLVQQSGMAIDMPAGPSEVLVIADETGVPEFIAADLLSQAEHGEDSQVVLLSTSERLIKKTFKSH